MTWQERFDGKFVVKEENGLSKFKQEIIDRPYLIKDFIASEREALLREIIGEVVGLYQDTTIHTAGGTYFEREESEINETIDEVLSIIRTKW